MSLLFKNFRVHQVFGANTDVGKTILTVALCRAAAALPQNVFYLKPVSTGSLDESDQSTVQRHAKSVNSACLYQFDHPVSPHLAAQLVKDGRSIPSDATVVNAVSAHVRQCASRFSTPSHMFVETAGGVHSPSLSGSSQLDLYRPLLLPTVLVGDSKLGGISTTISAFESLLLRGYTVDLVMLFRDEYYRNWEYLQKYFQQEHGIAVQSFEEPPPILPDAAENHASTEKYFEDLQSDMISSLDILAERHTARIDELASMPRRTLDSIWWPFVQHGLVKSEKDVTIIDSAHSDFFNVTSHSDHSTSLLEPQLDGSASWWTQALGHAHPSLTLAASRASGRYGHVMFPQASHLPALRLSETLLRDGPGKDWASRVFFSDDGSTGMEVALKMALRYYSSSHRLEKDDRKNLGVLGLKGSYHGDTIGAMDATEDSGVYTCEWHDAKGYWLDSPTVAIQKGQVVVTLPSSMDMAGAQRTTFSSLSQAYDVESRLNSPLAHSYSIYLQKKLAHLQESGLPIATLVLEPIVMGAGGMIFVDPLFQRVLVDVVRSTLPHVPVIFDEVFIGFYRLGFLSSTSVLKVNPDISVNAKILTGGLLPMAVTLASSKIFEVFMSEDKADALLHGHSYTAHPVGCEVANETLKIVKRLEEGSEVWKEAKEMWSVQNQVEEKVEGGVWSLWDPGFIKALSGLEVVEEVMALGTVLAFKVKGSGSGYTSHSAVEMLRSLRMAASSSQEGGISSAPGGASFSVHYRTLGDVAYFMTSLNTSSHVMREIEDKIWRALKAI